MFINESYPTKTYVEENIINEIKTKITFDIELTLEEENILLDYLITKCWEDIENYFNIDTTSNPLTNKCDYAQKVLGKSLENLGITVYPKETGETIMPHVIGHSFLIVKFSNHSYIVAPTYRQFLTLNGCNPKNFIIYNNRILKTPDPGLFIIQSEQGKRLADTLVAKGYITLSEENAKLYCDSFYYTNQGTYLENGKIPISNIDGSIYLNSLLKENHKYATSDERFNKLYPSKKEVSKWSMNY